MFTVLPRLLLLLCLAAWCCPVLPAPATAAGWDELELTPQLIRQRYGLPRDAISVEQAEQLMLNMVNAAREATGSTTLGWSADATLMAQLQADAMTEGRFGAHLDLDGRGPDLRWNALGGSDQVAENVIYYEVPAEVALTPDLLWSMLQDWVSSPGHFANLKRWQHTALGFAVSIRTDGETSYIAGVQEFVTDLGEYDLLPEAGLAGEELLLQGTLAPGRIELAGVALADLPAPETQTAESLNSLQLSYPTPVYAWLDEERVDFDLETGAFSAALQLPQRSGISVYVSVWARYEDDAADAAPFCVMTQVVQLN